MLVLASPQATAEQTPLRGGAYAMIRPATSLDVDVAQLRIQQKIYAIKEGDGALHTLLSLLGLPPVEGSDDDFLEAVGRKMAALELAQACVESWHGVVDEAGVELPVTPANLALLLRDPELYDLVWTAMNRRLYAVSIEGNASSASLSGAALADDHTAPTAEPLACPAQEDAPTSTASSALK